MNNKDLKKYPRNAQASISKGLKDGTVRFEKTKQGGEYIASPDKSFGRKPTTPNIKAPVMNKSKNPTPAYLARKTGAVPAKRTNAQYGKDMQSAINNGKNIGVGVGGEPQAGSKEQKVNYKRKK